MIQLCGFVRSGRVGRASARCLCQDVNWSIGGINPRSLRRIFTLSKRSQNLLDVFTTATASFEVPTKPCSVLTECHMGLGVFYDVYPPAKSNLAQV